MKKKFSEMFTYVQDKADQAARTVNEFVEKDSTKAAVEWTKQADTTVANEAVDLGKRAANSEMAKDAATGAAVGAAIAVPVPIVGPIFGAVVGAGLGVAKNLMSDDPKSPGAVTPSVDIHKVLTDLEDLRQKGIITDEEFEKKKTQILRGR